MSDPSRAPALPLLSRRQLLQGAAAAAAAAALPFGGLSCGRAGSASGPLVVGGLPVTCNLTLPVACEARAATNSAAPAGAAKFEYEYSKYNGWPELKESL